MKKSDRSKYWLYLPIETKVRDLYGKTLLASFAAINGFNVLLGSKKDINSRSIFFPSGIIFNVGLAKNLARDSKRFKKEGHKVAVMDEEGLVTLKDDIYLHQRVSNEGLENADCFFCWGEKQSSIIEKKSDKKNCRIFITGNSRFDILRSEYKNIFKEEANDIKKKYKKLILINTNFGRGNHFAGDNFLLDSLKQKGWMENKKDEKYILANIEWQKKMFREFQEIIPELSERFGDHKIIIRPHPSENHNFWKEIAKNYSNVFVIHEGNVIPWLMAADILVHNGCTTAIEAFILGTRAVAYRPFIIEDQETELPNKISAEVHNSEELVDIIKEIIEKPNSAIFDHDSKKKYLNYFLSGIRGKTASERISFVIKSIAQANDKKINIILIFIFDFFELVAAKMRKILSRKNDNNVSLAYQLHKNPGLIKKDFQELIEKFSKINSNFSNLKVKRVGVNCYQIYEDK